MADVLIVAPPGIVKAVFRRTKRIQVVAGVATVVAPVPTITTTKFSTIMSPAFVAQARFPLPVIVIQNSVSPTIVSPPAIAAAKSTAPVIGVIIQAPVPVVFTVAPVPEPQITVQVGTPTPPALEAPTPPSQMVPLTVIARVRR